MFNQACQANFPWGCEHAAWTYKDEKEVRDQKKALDLFHKAAGLGAPGAWLGLGCRTKFGEGTEVDPDQAAGYFRKACELGIPDACKQ